MEVLFEKLIELFLTCNGKVFAAPQYAIDWDADTKTGGTCPDLVLIDESNADREVVVVEVTTAASLNNFHHKILERKKNWFDPLKAKLNLKSDVRAIVFIRLDLVSKAEEWANEQCISTDEVCFYPIEKAVFWWHYRDGKPWPGLPRGKYVHTASS